MPYPEDWKPKKIYVRTVKLGKSETSKKQWFLLGLLGVSPMILGIIFLLW